MPVRTSSPTRQNTSSPSTTPSFQVFSTIPSASPVSKASVRPTANTLVPAFLSSVFSADGLSLTVSFTLATNRARLSQNLTFSCNQLFIFSCAETSTCRWSNTSQSVTAQLDSGASCVRPGDFIRLNPLVKLRASCTLNPALPCKDENWPAMAAFSALSFVTVPKNAISPTVVISLPTISSHCSPLTLDITGSQGSLGRDWKNVSIVVTSRQVLNQTMLLSINQFFLSSYRVNPPTPLPASLLQANTSYQLAVSLCNFLGRCARQTRTVFISAEALPTVVILSSTAAVSRSKSFSLLSSVTLPPCSSAGGRSLSYRWSVFSLPEMTELPSLVSRSNDPSRFLLPAYSFPSVTAADRSFLVRLSVSLGDSSSSSSAAVTVLVSAGDLVAVLRGSSSPSRSVRVGESLLLDLSASYDEALLPTSKQLPVGTLFQWRCVSISGTGCDGLFVNGSSLFALSTTQSTILLRPQPSTSGQSVSLTVTLSHASSGRSTQLVIGVQILDSLAPQIDLSLTSSQSTRLQLLNPSQSVQLRGVVSIPVAGASELVGEVGWSLLSLPSRNEVNLTALSLTPVRQSFSAMGAANRSTSFTSTIFLVLRGNSLVGGVSYSVSLRAALLGGVSSTASLTISINAPPSMGSFSVQPGRGQEIVDSFSLSCEQWADDQLPLAYQFAYFSPSSGLKILLRSSSIVAYFSTELPAGFAANNYSLAVLADVFDALAANSSVSLLVQVTPLSLQLSGPGGDGSASTNLTAIVSGLLDITQISSVDEIFRKTLLASSVMNLVNCSLAPNCSALHRSDCLRTAHTCGPCQSSSMIGIGGDSNEPCYFPAAFSSSLLSPAERVKGCPGNCSYPNGQCSFVSVTTGQQVSRCVEDDPSCVSRCLCAAGFAGSVFCDQSDDQVASQQRLREQAVDNLAVVMARSDLSAESIPSLLGGMRELSQVKNELSSSSLDQLLSLSGQAVTSSRSNELDSDVLAGMDDQLDALVDALVFHADVTARARRKLTDSPSLGTSLLHEVVRNYSLFLSEQLVDGLPPTRIAANYLKVFAQAIAPVQSDCLGGNLSFSLPQTSYEAALAIPTASSLVLPACFNSSLDRRTVSFFSLPSQLYDRPEFTADPLSLHLSSLPCLGTSLGSCAVDIVLRADNSLLFPPSPDLLLPAENVTVECFEGDRGNHSLHCPSTGRNYSVTCRGERKTIVATCPAQLPPELLCRDIAAPTASCRLVNYTATTATCSCSLLPSARRALRSLSSTGNSSEDDDLYQSEGFDADYVSMLSAVEGDFTSTVLSASSLSADKLADSITAVVTMSCLLLGILLALGLAHWADKKAEKKIGVETNIMMHALVSRNNQQAKTAHRLAPSDEKKKKRITSLLPSSMQRMSQRISFFSGTAGGGGRGQLLQRGRAVENNRQSIMELAEEALPLILSSHSTLVKRIWQEMKRHHRWLGIVFHFSPKFPRILRVLSLATNILIMLFVQSLTYNFTHGDNGECRNHLTRSTCLSRPSDFGSGESQCLWTPSTAPGHIDGEGSCAYNYPENSITVVLFVAIFSALTSAPLALLADWMIQNILAAPTKNEKQKDAVKVLSSAVDGLEDGHPATASSSHYLSFEKDVLHQERIEAQVLKEFLELKRSLLDYRSQLQFAHEIQEFNGKPFLL